MLRTLCLVSVAVFAVAKDLNCIPVVLEGYDVVEYHKLDYNTCGSVLGVEDYTYDLYSRDAAGDHRAYQFWFSSKENLDSFANDPWRFAPRFGGF